MDGQLEQEDITFVVVGWNGKKKRRKEKGGRGEASRKEKLKCKIPMCLGQSSVNYNARQRSKVIGI